MPPSHSNPPSGANNGNEGRPPRTGFLRGRWRSFGFAWQGIKWLFGHERNAMFHLGAAIVVIIAGIILHLAAWEWCTVIFCIGGMFTAEGMNTAVEKLADHVCSDWNENIKIVKDVAAGAVFLMTFACIAVGLIVFLPKFLAL